MIIKRTNIFHNKLVSLVRQYGSIHYYTANKNQVTVNWTCFIPGRHRVTTDDIDEFPHVMEDVLDILKDYPKKGHYYRYHDCGCKIAR